MVHREESLIEPRKASHVDPDTWPIFSLQCAKVTSATGDIVSLFSTHRNNPVKVSGKLDAIDDDFKHLLRDKNYVGKSIELDPVTQYAFAEYSDGTFGFWAAGKAGWFELQSPASSFKSTYFKMNEAPSIFYMLADRVRKGRVNASHLSLKELRKYMKKVFAAYCAQSKNPSYPTDVDEAREIFHEHQEFLMTSMLEGQDGLDWMQTPMLKYFKMQFPDDYTAIEARCLQPIKKAASPPEPVSKDSRNTSRKRKSQSPHHDDSKYLKKPKRKAAQEAESRIQELPQGLLPKTPDPKELLEGLSSDDDENGNAIPVKRKQKSILQPSGGKYSQKAAARHGELDAGTKIEDEDDTTNGDESPTMTARHTRHRDSGSTPTSRSSPDASNYLPPRHIELKVVQYDIPSTDPQGPGDLWTCMFGTCRKRIYEASTIDGQSRVKEHVKSHASQAQEKIELVLNESRPYLPVDNLVRRLQAFAPKTDNDLENPAPPMPIWRRY